MGWMWRKCTRRDLVARRIRSRGRFTHPGDHIEMEHRVIAHCYRGNPFSGVLWTVHEILSQNVDGEWDPSLTTRYIGCDLLSYHRASDEWGYKDLEESCDPHACSCPLGYLEMVPGDKYYTNEDWRARVREYHAIRKRKREAKKAAKLVNRNQIEVRNACEV